MGVIQNAVDSLITTATSMSYNSAYRKSMKNVENNTERMAQQQQAMYDRVNKLSGAEKTAAGLEGLTPSAEKAARDYNERMQQNYSSINAAGKPETYTDDNALPYRGTPEQLTTNQYNPNFTTDVNTANASMQAKATITADQQKEIEARTEALKNANGKIPVAFIKNSPDQVAVSRYEINDTKIDSITAGLLGSDVKSLLDKGVKEGLTPEETRKITGTVKRLDKERLEKILKGEDEELSVEDILQGEDYDRFVKDREEDYQKRLAEEERNYLTGEQLDKYKSEYDTAVKTKVADETGKDIDYSVDFEPSPDDTPEERKWKNFYKARSEEKRTGQDFIKENADSVPMKDVKYGVKDFFTEYAYKALKNPDKYKKIEDLSYDEAKALYNNYATEQASKNLERRVKAIDKSKDRYSKIKYLRDNSKNRRGHNYSGIMDSDYDIFGPDFVNGKTDTPSYPSIVYEYGLTFDEVFSIWSNLENYVGAAYDHGQPIDDNYSAAILEGIADVAPEKLKAHDEKVSKKASDSLVNSLDKSEEAMFDEYGNVKEEFREEFNKQLAEEQTVKEETKKNPFDFDDIFKDGKFKF